MTDPHHIAWSIVGRVEWETEVSGFCRCPGEALHTAPTGRKDCRVSIDGAPTIFCFHASCEAVVAEANRRLRASLGSVAWELKMPTGDVLRSGDVLEKDGTVIQKAGGAELRNLSQNSHGSDGSEKSTSTNSIWRIFILSEGVLMVFLQSFFSDLRVLRQILRLRPNIRLCSEADEKVVLATIRVNAERFRPELFQIFQWPVGAILRDSPLQVSERDAEDQFRTWLKLWPPHCHVWIGDIYNSGKPEHRTHFRPITDWYQIGPVLGNYTCGSSFKPGSFRRSNETLNGHRFLVLESDSLAKNEVGAIFAYLRQRLRYRLHCIIDTGGKSLHAWFDAPRDKVRENRLKAGLTALGCDPKVFTYSQPVRVPGAWRDGKLQKLIWLKE